MTYPITARDADSAARIIDRHRFGKCCSCHRDGCRMLTGAYAVLAAWNDQQRALPAQRAVDQQQL